MRPSEDLSWLAVARGVTPIAAGWSQNAGVTGPSIFADGFRPAVTGTNDAFVVRRLIPTDPIRGAAARISDTVELQFQFAGVSNTPAAWTASGVHVAFIDDGNLVMGVGIGPILQWVNPYTGAVIGTIRSGWPWQPPSSLLLCKVGSERWQVWQGGVLLDELGYEMGAATQSVAAIVNGTSKLWSCPRVGWGRLNTAGTRDGRWDKLEVGTNVALPRQWQVDRVYGSLPGPVRSHWSVNWEAVTRTIVGETQQAKSAMDRAWPSTTAGRVVEESAAFSGTALPWVEDPQWTILGSSGSFTIVAERVRIAGTNASTAVQFSPVTTTEAEYLGRATFLLLASDTRDKEGRVGPAIQIRNGDRRITAQMLWDDATQTYGWFVHDGDVVGGPLGIGGNVFWPVNVWIDHVVELRVLRHDRVILVVDDQIVDDIPYSRFTAATASRVITLGKGDDPSIAVVCAMAAGAAEVAHSDQATRPAFLQALAEKLVFVGGRETNPRLETWGDDFPGVHSARGTLHGLRREYRRIAGHDDIDLHKHQDPAGWFLNRTWPGVTPVFLNATGLLTDVWVEFYNDIPNYTPEAFCELIHRYLAPLSLFELQIHCGLITDLDTAVVTTSVSTFTVANPLGFAVDDVVDLRETTTGTMATITYLDDDILTGADAGWAGVNANGELAGLWRIDSPGLGELELLGTFAQIGLDTDKDANLAANGTVTVLGGAAGVVGKMWVFGLDAGGLAQYEEFTLNGTTPVVGVKTFLASGVYGAVLHAAQPSTVTVRATTGAVQLYVITAGAATGGGCLSFDPPLRGAPGKIDLLADAATTAKVLLFGVTEVSQTFQGEVVTLNGTTKVPTAVSYEQIRVICLGYVPAARTVTFNALAVDTTAVIRLVSTSAADLQGGIAVGVDPQGVAQLERFTLAGLATVTLTKKWGRPCGIRLIAGGAAVGTVTATMVNSTVPTPVTITLFKILPGRKTAAYDQRGVKCRGTVRIALNQPQSTIRTVIIVGTRHDTGDIGVEAIRLNGTTFVDGLVDFDRIDGVATGHVPNTKYVKVEGGAWFAEELHDAQNEINPLTEWTITGVPSDQAVATYIEPSRGTESGLRDQKSPRHSTALASWPVAYHTTKTGIAPARSLVTADGTTNRPIVAQIPVALDQFAYNLTGASLTDFQTLWASGTWTVFFRYRLTLNNGGGIYHVIKANGGTGATSEQVGINGLGTLRCRFNGVDNAQATAGSINTWYSGCVTMTANTSQWYKDGAAVGGTVAHGGAGAATLANFLRNISTTDNLDFADFALYKRALTSGEVATLHANTDGIDPLRIDASLWAHYLDPDREAATALVGGPVAIPGWDDTVEGTRILTIDPVTGVTTTNPVVAAFTAAAVLRKTLE